MPRRGHFPIRFKLVAAFAAVILLLSVASLQGSRGAGHVSQTVRSGYGRALVANAASTAAYNMRVSQIQNALDGGRVVQMHSEDVAGYETAMRRSRALATSPEDRRALARIDAVYARWTRLDRQIAALWRAGRVASATRPARHRAAIWRSRRVQRA